MSYNIIGTLLNSNKQPLTGLKVSIWDKDKKISDHLGMAFSDANGQFNISFKKRDFFDGKEDTLPDVFFLVYQGDRVIHSTEGSPIKNAKDLKNITLVIDTENNALNEEIRLYSLEGIVQRNKIKAPLKGLMVEAWDKDKKVSDQLGIAITDDKGAFLIQYENSRFIDGAKEYLPDVFFRVYQDEDLVHSTEGKPLKNVGNKKGIIIQISCDLKPEIPKFPNFSKSEITNLAKHALLSPHALKKKHPKVYTQIKVKAQQELVKKTVSFFEKASYDLKTFTKSLDFSKLNKENDSVKAYIEEQINKGYLPHTLKSEARVKLSKWDGPNTLNDVIQPEIPLQKNALLEEEKQQSYIYDIANLANLDNKVTRKLIDKEVFVHTIGTENIDHLVKEKVLTKKQGDALHLNANIYTLAKGNIKLSEAIKKHRPNRSLKSMKELSALNVDDWKSILTAAQVSGDDTIIEKLAKVKQRQIEILYPHEVFKVQSKKSELPTVRPLMNKFYRVNDNIPFLKLSYKVDSEDIDSLDLDNFTESEQNTILENLKTNQLLYSLTDSTEETFQLKKEYSSAREIVMDGFYEFKRKTDFDEATAKRIYDQSEKRAYRTNIALGNILGAVTDPWGGRTMGNMSIEAESYLRRLNGYEDFFGETDFCKCKHCASIISPAAYFVDLMDFLKENVLSSPLNSDGHTFIEEAKNSILNPKVRRLDLWSGLVLNCEHTHKLVPYLTIINEVLENFIYLQSPGFSALPEHRTEVENHVYFLLSKNYLNSKIYSIHQPFHLPLTELEIYLEHFPITRASIAEILLTDINDTEIFLAQTKLRLSLADRMLIEVDRSSDLIARDTNRNILKELYGIDIPETAAVENLEVQQLLSVLSINRDEFSELFKTQFAFPSSLISPSEVRIRGGRKDGSLQVNIEYIDGIKQFHLDRMHRFIRLWRQLDWTILELDQVISCLNNSLTIDNGPNLYLIEIAALIDIQKTLGFSIDELCTLIHAIPTKGHDSFFDQRFNLESFIKEESDRWSNQKFTSSAPVNFLHPNFKTTPSGAGSTIDDELIHHRLLAGFGVNDEEFFALITFLIDELKDDPSNSETDPFRLTIGKLSLLYRHVLLLKKYKLSVAELFFLISIEPTIASDYLENISDVHALIKLLNWYDDSDYTNNELRFILDGVNHNSFIRDPNEIAQVFFSEIQTSQSLLFTDTVFAFAEGITEKQSLRIIENNTTVIIPADLRKYHVKNLLSLPFVIPTDVKTHLSAEQQIKVISRLIKLVAEHVSDSTHIILETELTDINGIQNDGTINESKIILDANRAFFELIPGETDKYQVISGVASDPAPVGLDIPIGIWSVLSTTQQQELYLNILRYLQLGAPEFTDRVFVGIADLTLEQSREILVANRTIFEEIKRDVLFWLSTDFNVDTHLVIPVDIPLTSDKAQEMILVNHTSRIITNLLSKHLGISVEKVIALTNLSGYDIKDSIYTQIAQGTRPISELTDLIADLQKLAIWFKDNTFNAKTLSFLETHSGDTTKVFHINNPDGFRTPSLEHIMQTKIYRTLLKKFNEESLLDALHVVLNAYDFNDTQPKFINSVSSELAELFDAEESLITALNNSIHFPNENEEGDKMNMALKALVKFEKVLGLQRYLGVGVEVLPLFISTNFNELTTSVRAVITAIRTKYDSNKDWEEKIGPFEDKIRERKRDALADHLIHTFQASLTSDQQWFQSTHDLYNYFLIDTELEGCARTSRVVAGLSSLQLYIQRCLLNLEQNEDGTIHVKPEDIPQDQWQWRKNYRVWEANRKVFLYPENYIEPDLRDNKTELFKELESTLLQQEINSQNSEEAYAKYLTGFDEISKLKIAGSYHHLGNLDSSSWETEPDILYLFGVTYSEPMVYYYRVIENLRKEERDSNKFGVKYGSWTKVNLQIPVKKVSPIIYNNKLYLFWVDIRTLPKFKESVFDRYEHNFSAKFSFQRLDGTWNAPQEIDLDQSVVIDKLASDSDLINFRKLIESRVIIYNNRERLVNLYNDIHERDVDSFYTLSENGFWDDISMQAREILHKKYKDNFTLINSESYSEINVKVLGDEEPRERILSFWVWNNSNRIINLYTPKFDPDNTHFTPDDDYTIKGFEWDRIYPTINKGHLFLKNDLIPFGRAINLSNRNLYRPQLGFLGNITVTPDNRFNLKEGSLNYINGLLGGSYFNSEKILRKSINSSYLNFNEGLITNLDQESKVFIINGLMQNVILDVKGDLFLVYQRLSSNRSNYIIKRLNTTLIERINFILFDKGLTALLNLNTQLELGEDNLTFNFNHSEQWNHAQKSINKGIPDFRGSLGTYFREMFFHIPFLIANHLNSQNKFVEAQQWYHYIFNPTGNHTWREVVDLERTFDSMERKKIMAKRVWQFIEFRNHTLASWKEQLNDSKAISAYENDPFNPHAIARLRLGAYMKSITMKYIDNLLDWGDHLFAQDTMESINEATLLYSMASDILGQRPVELGECEQDSNDITYTFVRERMESKGCNNFLNGIETEVFAVPDEASETIASLIGVDILDAEVNAGMSVLNNNDILGNISNGFGFDFYIDDDSEVESDTDDSEDMIYTPAPFINLWGGLIEILPFHSSFLKQVCLFCIPPNPELLAYWDRVEDRLFKIRNCMNLSGVRRQLSLFAPEIDPRLLVRAKAAGLSLDEVLNSVQGDVPPYRFAFLLAKAKEYAGALQGFGGALLGALEKKSAEELTLLRLSQQDEVLKLTRRLRDMEVSAAEASLEGLRKREENIIYRKDYYNSLIETGLSSWESAQQITKHLANGLMPGVVAFLAISGGTSLIPRILGMANTTGGEEATDSLKTFGDVLKTVSSYLSQISDSMALEANFQRREQGWNFSLRQTENELKEIEKQLTAAEIRRDISIKSRELHEKSIEQHQETYEFYRDRFTNLGLYTWLSTQLHKLFRESYQNAMTLARMAERAYRFERNDDTTVLLENNYWVGPKLGLNSGGDIMGALRKMELRYMETNTRSMEIDQAFSLTQIDPKALLNLKAKGTCEFKVPELYFDLFYPGQYRRTIKSARLTIPCITGPYSNVSAVLTLKESYVRKEAKLPTSNDSGLTMVPASRTTSVATSTAQNDSGVFRLDFRDERYMPFEGAGAVESTWQIELPKTFRPFDYSSINDCILHISYTAEYDIMFRKLIENETGHLNTLLRSEEFSLPRAYSLRQEFSQTFHQLLHSSEDTNVSLELSEKHFPLFLQGKTLQIEKAQLIIEIDENGFRDDTGTFVIPDISTLEIGVEGNSPTGEINPGWSFLTDTNTTLISSQLGEAFINFTPVIAPLTINLKIIDGGDFSVETPVASDPSALDDHKVKDMYLLINYKVV